MPSFVTNALDFLSAYPPWLVIGVSVLFLVIMMWLAKKMIKWVLWFVVFVVVIGAILWAIQVLFK
jgi:hypothetical protein